MNLIDAVRPGSNQYISGEEIIQELPEYLKDFHSPAIITGEKSFEVFSNSFSSELEWPVFRYDGTSSEEDMAPLAEKVKDHDIIIGVGGGRVLDTTKGVADMLSKDYVLVPTIVSNCAPYTPIAVVYYPDRSFKTITYCKKAPYLTIVDFKLLLQTPKDYFIAGIGDTLAKWYEIEGITSRMDKQLKTAFIRLGIASAKEIYQTLFDYSQTSLESLEKQEVTDAFCKITDTIIGVAGVVGGFAGVYGRSAGAHAVHNGLSYVFKTHDVLHGSKVAYGILVQLATVGNFDEIIKLLPFYRQIGLPTNLAALNISNNLEDAMQKTAKQAASPSDGFKLMLPDLTEQQVVEAMQKVEELIDSLSIAQ
ncbi:glycerol dehydrogenase [Melissococcus plutonius]|uniref:iron-containing alcohol dehydrogenase family protein n=1 Tax=Melissococcus plutonius TaxID=33970 RepID=UPI00065DE34C|nr:iron-containing alcohol dehydrogenase family protein [Melissococcus plutonius]KMT31980.1 glycerol dehydrogenase [Melissococcus plutonius]KMT32384.1 glycerol dehydrogenase [Melissococcus plutonius]KMT34097.1 glycerol dehydrogenase [Melissococcus plutonius]